VGNWREGKTAAWRNANVFRRRRRRRRRRRIG